MLIDTHCHLHDREFYTLKEAEKALARAHKNGVEKIICIGTSHEDSLAAQKFAKEHENVYWTYGIHPENASQTLNTKIPFSDITTTPPPISDVLTTPPPISDVLTTPPPIAIGEIGLDYHYENYDKNAQIKLFEQMLQLAQDHDLPLSFHVREAFDDFFFVIKNFPKIRATVHSFSDNKKTLKRILEETDFYIGINGMATYSTLPTPPLERIVLETDAPFLTPVPFRGIINGPSHIRDIATWLSTKLAVDLSIIEQETTRNARKLFHI